MSSSSDTNNNNNSDSNLLAPVEEEDYYTNPLVSTPTKVTGTDDDLTKMVKSLTGVGANNNPNSLSSPFSNLEGSGSSKSYVGDPFFFEGKLVKFARFFISNVEVSQGSSWPGYQDYYEQGRLMGFSITCNDPDIIPICLIENGSGSKDVINDLSFKESTMHGRGMTYSEATSTYRTPDGLTSRDVSGTPGNLFPHVIRYKDQFTGTGIYNDIKNTVDDKTYVMSFEPTLFIPYQRFYFDVFNGSQIGNKLINRLEIKRLVYVTPDQISTNAGGNTTDLTQFNQNLLTVYDKMNNLANSTVPTPAQSVSSLASPPPITTAVSSGLAKEIFQKNYEDYITYSYNQLKNKNTLKVDLTGEKVKVADKREQQRMKDLMNMANYGSANSVKPKLNKNNYIQDNTMRIKWE